MDYFYMLEFGGLETKDGTLLLTSGSPNCSLNDHEIMKERTKPGPSA